VDPVPDPLLLRKSGSAGNRTWDLRICSQELLPLDHRGGLVAVAVNLRSTLSRPVCPGVSRPSGICDQFFFLLDISFRHLRVCNFVAPSLDLNLILSVNL
jgi:hypothetical protein